MVAINSAILQTRAGAQRFPGEAAVTIAEIETLQAITPRRYLGPASWKIGTIGNSVASNGFRAFTQTAASQLNAISMENVATGGALSADLVAQIASLSSSVTHCFVLEGTNDAAQSVSVATHITNMKAVAAALLAQGIIPIIVAAPTRDASTAQAQIMAKMALAERIWCENAGLIFVDPWNSLIDTDGTWVSGATSDGDHPTVVSHQAIGRQVATLLSTGSPGLLLPRCDGGSDGGILTNALNLADGNADGLPDGWTALGSSGTYALSTGADPTRGDICTATLSQTTTAEFYRSITPPTVGNRIRVVGMLSLANASNVIVRAYLRSTGQTDVISAILTENDTNVYMCGEIISNTEVQFWIEAASINGSAYTANVAFSAVQAYDIDANTL